MEKSSKYTIEISSHGINHTNLFINENWIYPEWYRALNIQQY